MPPIDTYCDSPGSRDSVASSQLAYNAQQQAAGAPTASNGDDTDSKAVAQARVDLEKEYGTPLTPRMCDVVFRISSAAGFDVDSYGKRATKIKEGRAAVAALPLLKAEIRRRGLKHADGTAKCPNHWPYRKCVECLAGAPLGFRWVDPEPEPEPAASPSGGSAPHRITAEREGVRVINFIAAHRAEYEATKAVDTRAQVDKEMGKPKAERKDSAFWRSCAAATMSTEADPDVDELQIDSMNWDANRLQNSTAFFCSCAGAALLGWG